MKMRKLKLIVISICLAFLISLGFVSATTYTHDSNGFHIFEDFDTYNTSMYYLSGTQIGINSGFMKCVDNDATATNHFEALWIINKNYSVNPRDEWAIRYNVTGVVNYDWANVGTGIQSNNSFIPTTAGTIHYFTLIYNNGYPPSAYSLLQEYLNVSPSHYTSSGLGGEGITSTPHIYTWIKTNLDNNTFKVDLYKDNSFIHTFYSYYNITDYPSVFWRYFIRCQFYSAQNHNLQIDWFELNVTRYKEFVIQLYNPPDETRTNINENVTFKFINDENATSECSLYIDDQLNKTNSSVLNNTLTSFVVNWTDGYHTWRVECYNGQDNATSETRLFIYDSSEPVINSVSPSPFNNTIFTNNVMTIIGNVTDNSLYRVNRTIFYPNGSVFYNNFSGDLEVNTTLYSWNETFNTTNMPNGYYRMLIEAADSHTKRFFKPAKKIEKLNNQRKLKYELDHDKVEIALVDGDAIYDFDSVDTQKLKDRYTFDFNFKKQLKKGAKLVFEVKSEHKIKYFPNSKYKAHFILANKYWVDFEGIEGNYTVVKIKDNLYHVVFTINKPMQALKMHSLGGLNENAINITFQIDNCVPDWTCVGYTECYTNNTQNCINVTDNNNCGVPYTGDYSEFGVFECDYCTPDITLYNSTICINSTQTNCYIDNNFETCCNVTRLASDCYSGIVQNESIVCVEEACSMFYSADDLPLSVFDAVVKFIILFGIFISPALIIYLGFQLYKYTRR